MRYFEDLREGETIDLGMVTVTADEIVDFASRYDPQPFHVDPDAAARSIYGGLIASGWHTCALFMRLLATGFLNHTASFGSPGVEELRWQVPVRPGDALTGTIEILSTRESRSRPDRGIVTSRGSLTNGRGETALSLVAVNLIGRRSPGAPEMRTHPGADAGREVDHPVTQAGRTTGRQVTELRLVVTTDDFERALHLYRDVLGMPELPAVSSPHGRIAILEAGRATLELSDHTHAAYIDEVEVGHRVAGHIRVALGVMDVDRATDQVVDAGATLIAPPVPTPWGSRNARLSGPAGLQLTLFGG